MKTIPVREKDSGPIINWIADQVNRLGCWLVEITIPYALFYEVDIEEDNDSTRTRNS